MEKIKEAPKCKLNGEFQVGLVPDIYSIQRFVGLREEAMEEIDRHVDKIPDCRSEEYDFWCMEDAGPRDSAYQARWRISINSGNIADMITATNKIIRDTQKIITKYEGYVRMNVDVDWMIRHKSTFMDWFDIDDIQYNCDIYNHDPENSVRPDITDMEMLTFLDREFPEFGSVWFDIERITDSYGGGKRDSGLPAYYHLFEKYAPDDIPPWIVHELAAIV